MQEFPNELINRRSSKENQANLIIKKKKTESCNKRKSDELNPRLRCCKGLKRIISKDRI